MDKHLIGTIDLNIGENYLNHWEVYHAIREIIANALDEKGKKDIEITGNEEKGFIIRDYAGGLIPNNFVMDGSNKENRKDVIGKFGVGLKDAIGVLYNNGIVVTIRTAKYLFEVGVKENSSIITSKILSVYVYENNEKDFIGTEFVLKNCKEEYIKLAKMEFLLFRNPRQIEKTKYGQVLEKENEYADIYVCGMKVSEDWNLEFSYNITNMSADLRKGLNRERKYVSRDAYREDIKNIIKKCSEIEILDAFEKQLKRTYGDNNYSEIKWNVVLIKITKYIINKYKHKDVRFISSEDIINNRDLYNILCKDMDVEVIEISKKIKMDLIKYKKDIIDDNLFYDDSIIIEKELLTKEELTEKQRMVLEESIKILKKIDLLKSDYISIENIKISRVDTAKTIHEGYGIIISLSSLVDIETCSVKIINVSASLGDNSAEFKEKIFGNLIKIIYEQSSKI